MTNVEMEAIRAADTLSSVLWYLLWHHDFTAKAFDLVSEARTKVLLALPYGSDLDLLIRDNWGSQKSDKWRILAKDHPEWFGGK